ncbi:MAG TPA: hypothetical protein VF596_12460 [Pyrinomonadaceae bacterium]|jgi:hypothetical protein
MKRVVVLFTVVFCFTVSTFAQNNSTAVKQTDSDESIIYKTVLDKLFITRKAKQLIVYKFTSGKSVGSKFVEEPEKKILLSPGRQNAPVEPETIENYDSLNRESIELTNTLGIAEKVHLVPDEELQPFLDALKAYPMRPDVADKSYRDALLKKYGTTTIIRFSRIGFNKSRNQALIHVEYFCGSLCAGGDYLVLSKKNKQWTIVKGLDTWVS